MNELTLEWVNKAEDDFAAAGVLLRARKRPLHDAVCFHAQQCAEKYLKAVLQENGEPIPKIHHLTELLSLVIQIEPGANFLLGELQILEDYAVIFRYPGMATDKDEAKAAYHAAKLVRQYIRQHLGLNP